MGTGLRLLAILTPVIAGLVSGLLFYAGMHGPALAVSGAYLLLFGALAALRPERLRSFFLHGVGIESWSPALQLLASEEVSLPSMRFSGALALVMGAALLWAALFWPG